MPTSRAAMELSQVCRKRSKSIAWLVWTFCLSLLFGRIAAYNLGNYRPVTNDEVELMSVAYKLATRGVLGSDLFAGFFGADQHFFFVLPLQHVLDAISFRLFEPGVAEARWVSLVAGVSIIWSVGWLAYRWYGLGAALVAELLLVAWPTNLTEAAYSLPLFGVARVARYDVLAVAFAWIAIVLLDVTLRHPRAMCGFALGVCCGLAALTTFLGGFVLPLVVLTWLWARGRTAMAQGTLFWILAGAGLVVLPGAVTLAQFPGDLAGQLSVYGQRGDFLRPSFYVTNISSELSRYSHALDSPDSPAGAWLLVVGGLPAVAYVTWRAWRRQARGDRMLLASLLTFGGLLVLIDQTKTPLYAIVLFPSLCVALAALVTGAFGWAWRQHGQPTWGLRLVSVALSVGLAFPLGSEAVQAYQLTLAQSAAAGLYLDVGGQIDSSLAPGARVLGPERWWWALHAHPYLSLRNLWFQWTASASKGQTPEFANLVTWSRADAVIVNDNVRGDVLDFPDTLQQQFWTFINTCTQRVADLNDPTYLDIEVYEIIQPSPRPEGCGSAP